MAISYHEYLREAARRKGAPLSNVEREDAHKAWQQVARRDELRARFLSVIRLAGYKNSAPEEICNQHFEQYMNDIPAFEKMLTDYERNNGDPE